MSKTKNKSLFRTLDTSYLYPMPDSLDEKKAWKRVDKWPEFIPHCQFQVYCNDSGGQVSFHLKSLYFHIQELEHRAFAHILPSHLPANMPNANEDSLSVDILLMESLSLVQLRRQLPLLNSLFESDPNWHVKSLLK